MRDVFLKNGVPSAQASQPQNARNFKRLFGYLRGNAQLTGTRYWAIKDIKRQGCLHRWIVKIKKHNIPAIVDPSQICRALVGLKGIEILFYRRQGSFAEIAIQQTIGEPFCKSCGSRAYVNVEKYQYFSTHDSYLITGCTAALVPKKTTANLTNSARISSKQTVNPWWNAR